MESVNVWRDGVLVRVIPAREATKAYAKIKAAMTRQEKHDNRTAELFRGLPNDQGTEAYVHAFSERQSTFKPVAYLINGVTVQVHEEYDTTFRSCR